MLYQKLFVYLWFTKKYNVMKEESAIEYCEREFPQMMEEFKKIGMTDDPQHPIN